MQQRKLPAPLLIPVLFWCAGILLAKVFSPPFWLLAALGVVLMLLSAFVSKQRIVFLLLVFATLGGMRYVSSQRPTPLSKIFLSYDHIQQDAVFHVKQLLSRESGLYEIQLERLAGTALKDRLLLFSVQSLEPGKTYSALLEILPGRKDPVLDNYPSRHRAYIRQGLTEQATRMKFVPVAAWRASLLASLDAKLGAQSDFTKALLFSDTSARRGYKEELTRSGMTHLIVVSGLHVWFIYLLCIVPLNVLFPRRIAEAVFLMLITFYAALNYWSPSVLRSVLMIGLLIIARWRSIPLSGAQMLAVSLLLITVVAPEQFFDIGLQLSYLCIGTILLGLPQITWLAERTIPNYYIRSRLNNLLQLLLLNLVVGLAVLPLTLFYFGTGSLNGIIGNILGIPLTGALLMLGFVVLFLPGGSFIGAAYVHSYRFVLWVFEKWMLWVSRLPLYLENTWLDPWQLCGSLLIVVTGLIMLRSLKFNWRLMPVAALGAVLIAVPQLLLRDAGGIYIFASGTSDCVLIRLEEGQNILVDTGQMAYNAKRSWAESKLLPWLSKQRIRSLDWLILTHLDGDHSGGFPSLAKALTVRNVVVSDETMADPRWLDWQKQGLLRHSKVHCLSDTISYRIGETRLKFLHPDASFVAEDTNGASLVFRLDNAGRKYLFTGDADIVAEEHLLREYPEELDADYLKAGHHGSRSSNSPEFVRAVSPNEVWITASRRNRWNFPHPEPLNAFRRYAQSVRSTAEGTIYVPFAQND